MTAGRLDKSDTRKTRKPNEKDLIILAAKKDMPRATISELSDATGIPRSTVWDRLHRMPEQEWFKQARVEFEFMIGATLQNYKRRILNGDAAAAHDIAFGLQVLSPKVQTQNIPTDEGALLNELDNYDTARLRRFLDELRARRDRPRDPGTEVQGDEGLGPGKPTPPDA